MTRLLAAAIGVVLAGALLAATTDDGAGGPLDRAAAERCGVDLAQHAGFDASAASAADEDGTWRISVVTSEGALRLAVRAVDGRVLEADRVGPGGARALDREPRLAIFERGC